MSGLPMRDPKRIEPMLELIRQIWTAYPDFRLGQLIDNVSYAYRSYGMDSVFNVEDGDMLRALEAAAFTASHDSPPKDVNA